ncbi:glycosyltransferase [Candidatus Amesbacteria bacterium]|nr:glycosyltransferase [Candidatus Amesbacteria bacterium]
MNTLNRSIESLLQTRYSYFEVIIVDDQSNDGTYEILTKKFGGNKKIHIVRNDANSGPSKTRNTGISLSKSKYIAFYETDMECDPFWLLYLVRKLESDPSLAAAQSRILDVNNRNVIHSMGVLFDPHTFWVYSPGCGYHKNWLPKSLEMGIGAVESLIRKNVLEKIGGFDEQIIHNLDDIDLGYRIWLAGYKCITVPEAVTYHWTAKPSQIREKSTSSIKSEMHFHKVFRIFLKNYEIKSIFQYLPWLIFAYLLRAIYNFLKGNNKPFRALLWSVYWNILVLPNTLHERKRIQSLRGRTDEEIFQKIGLHGNFFQVFTNSIYFNLVKVQEIFG